MDPKARLDKELRNAGIRILEDPSEIKDSVGIKIEPAQIAEASPRYPFRAGRRCVNVIPGENGPRACGNPISRYSEFEVCNACKTEGGEAIRTLLRLKCRKGKRRR